MGDMLDPMDDAFGMIVEDGALLLDKEFMMGIFDPIKEKVPPIKTTLST